MDSAKAAVATAIPAMPADTRVGLMVFGHRRAKDCSDIQLVSPIGAESAQKIAEHVASLQPKGETPIAAAVEAGAKNFAALKGQNNAILLVTDGIEECGGNPCAAAKMVKEAGLNLKVDIVGLNLNRQQQASIDCLAKETGGKFFSADKAADFASTLKKAVKVAEADTAPKPAPKPQPTSNRVFFDGFKGDKLSADWNVTNPDPDSYVVEDGDLLMVSSAVSGFSDAKMANLITLQHALPSGDWDIHVKLNPGAKTGRDEIWVGLRKDDKNYLAGVFSTKRDCCGCAHVDLSLIKSSHGKIVRFTKPVRGGPDCSSMGLVQYDAAVASLKKKNITMTLSKRGHGYQVSVMVEGELKGGKQVVYATEPLTSLRPPGALTLGVSKWQNAQGEVSASVKTVEIDTIQNAGQ